MIRKKRDSLECFIKEQLIGPGGCKGLYSLKSDDQEKLGEVINTTPGSIYSSAILFPSKATAKAPKNKDEDDDENKNADEDENEDPNVGEGFSANTEDDEDINSLRRRFPNAIAVTCCLNPHFPQDNDLKVIISGRFYTKIEDCKQLEVNVEDQEGFDAFLKKYIHNTELENYLSYECGKLHLKDKTTQDKDKIQDILSDLKNEVREINKKIAFDIANSPDGVDPLYDNLKEYRYLSSYKEWLFKKISTLKPNNSYLSIEDVDKTKKTICDIEKYETFLAYIDDVLSICDSRNFGFWVEHPFNKEIDLSTINFNISSTGTKVIYSYKNKDYPCLADLVLRDINAKTKLSLSCTLQLIKQENGNTHIKVMLVNSSSEVETTAKQYYSIVSENVNERCFFGVKIDISSKHLCPYRQDNELTDIDDDEIHNLNFLYRTVEDYGVGHFCSVNWQKDQDNEDIIHIFSDFLPMVETPDVETEPRNKFEEEDKDGDILPKRYLENSECLQFKWLSFFSKTSNDDIRDGLIKFVDSYKKWIDVQNAQISSMEKEQKKQAEKNLQTCEEDYNRMKANIEEFLSDDRKMMAFRAMNGAMFMQLWHGKKENQEKIREGKPKLNQEFYENISDEIFPNVGHAAWRPFQLAFILINLDGIFKSKNDPEWLKRNELVDLVWFPTGGGKTEAYLGIIALAIISRRLINKEKGYGVSAIMRYTLRLLATQQFQRALRMILALEQIRLWDLEDCQLGSECISIGLFVGQGSLPNTFEELRDDVRNKWSDRKNDSKIPLDLCPWCGSKINYNSERGGSVNFYCENDSCTYDAFNAFPVRLCDEDIYKNPPTLLFGTVDKFAAIAHKVSTTNNRTNEDSRRIFGKGVNLSCLPPDLIIQDELHLLLGPLGSAVSLFECAIDQLCSREENIKGKQMLIRPKIISSTATTRNTKLQIRALYDRDVSIFPKNGIDYDDSFYAFYKRKKGESGGTWTPVSKRKYIGIMPTGRTQMTIQMRLAAILFVHRAIFEKENICDINTPAFINAADYYYTTISYFNSLKEVGKTDAQFYMEFTKYTRRLFKRVLRNSNMLECFYCYDDGFSKSELTGRLSGNEVVGELNKLQSITWSPEHRLPYCNPNSENEWKSPEKPDDYILATNMISVGLDVPRFNVIIMNSMPRNIAEYIQASSRVARNEAGLVLTIHNPFRSRDISHFEKFKEFHEKLYYYVEPISITPFSQKSVEKYLPLFVATYIRHFYQQLTDNNSAGNIDKDTAGNIKDKICSVFEKRLKRTEALKGIEKGVLTPQMFEYIKTMVDDLFSQWFEKQNENSELVYEVKSANNRIQKVPLYSSIDDYDNTRLENRWRVPYALRIIEPEAVIHVLNNL